MFAGSENLSGIRDVSAWLRNRDNIDNIPDLLRVIAVDTWLANTDRNWGNLIGESSGGEKIRLFFIDFEKSVALRPMPLMSAAEIKSNDLWPTCTRLKMSCTRLPNSALSTVGNCFRLRLPRLELIGSTVAVTHCLDVQVRFKSL